MVLTAGSRLGPYEIQAPLGAGGMGEVYRARDARLARDVALKVLPAAYSTDPDRLRRFQQEGRAAAALNHPNIVAIYDIGTYEGTPYVVSELLEGSTLRERLQGGALPTRKAVEIALDTARGLAAAHAKGIAHRDLKPENLFLTREGRAKILDFGLAKLTHPEETGRSTAPTRSPDTDPGMILGTAGYMAPEQVRGEPVDHRADLFALGAILYEMLTGKRPFHRATPVETMTAILNEDPPEVAVAAPRPIPPALDRIVSHCLEKDPAARFQSARDVAFNLEALSGLSEPSSTLIRPGVSPFPVLRRIRPAILAAALLALLGLGALAIWLALGTKGRTPPTYTQLTFRPGSIYGARFAPDGQTYVYAGSWDGSPLQLHTGRIGSPESRELSIRSASLLAVSSKGEMALSNQAARIAGGLTRGILARAPLEGGAPREILPEVIGADWSADGSAMAVVVVDSAYDRLEYPIGTVRHRTRGWMSDPRIGPDGRSIAFVHHPVHGDDRGTVMILGRDGKARALTPEFSTASGLAWSPSGREVWFTAGSGGAQRALYAVTASGSMRILDRPPIALTLRDVSRDGRVILSADENRADLYGIAAGEEHERNLTWLDFSVPADISPDGKTVLFTEQGSAAGHLYSVFVRGMDGSPPVRLGDGEAIGFSPDGRQVLAILWTSPPKLVVIPMGAGESRTLPTLGPYQFVPRSVRWMPDGKNIVFGALVSGREPRCYLQNVETGAIRPLTPEGVGAGVPSPRGDSLYAADATGTTYAYPVQGGKPTAVSGKGLEPRDKYLRFTPDGRTLFVCWEEERSAKLFRLDAVTRNRAPVRELKPQDLTGLVAIRSVSVSPDGRSFVYMARRYISRLYLAEGLR